MRIWDLSAGYLNRQSLLAEHRELHGIYSILTLGKQGYSRHPETLRWADAISGLVCRHRQLAAEMNLRGYVDKTPLVAINKTTDWPRTFVTEPAEQISLLREKYVGKERGRISLPRNVQELWAQHKYSVLARDPQIYRAFGKRVARMASSQSFAELVREFVLILRERPSSGGVSNAVEHMWGHVRSAAGKERRDCAERSLRDMLVQTQDLAVRQHERYLLSSTALSELMLCL